MQSCLSSQKRSRPLWSCISSTVCGKATVQPVNTIQMIIRQCLLQMRNRKPNLHCKTESHVYRKTFTSPLHILLNYRAALYKVKLSCPNARHEGIWEGGNRSRAQLILNFGTRLRWVLSFTPPRLYFRGKKSSEPTEKEAECATSLSVRFGTQIILPLQGIEPYVLNPYNQ